MYAELIEENGSVFFFFFFPRFLKEGEAELGNLLWKFFSFQKNVVNVQSKSSVEETHSSTGGTSVDRRDKVAKRLFAEETLASKSKRVISGNEYLAKFENTSKQQSAKKAETTKNAGKSGSFS